MLVCEGSLCPIKLPDVNGPGLGEAGRYRMVSELQAYTRGVGILKIAFRIKFDQQGISETNVVSLRVMHRT